MSYNRPTQSKAQNDSNAKILRALVKQPDNKVCADCKRNDPRWASWNIGCFLCIRCSGIHRSMGTHISKVKSIDLDIWTPEQMAAIQRWGNRLSNLYWEAHLKAGHVPPDHKVESFIRSKYELRRWAKDGPVPSDPSTLDGGAKEAQVTSTSSSASQSVSSPSSATTSRSQAKPTALDLLGGDPTPAAATTQVSSSANNANNLLDDFGSAPISGSNGSSRAAPSSRQSTAAAAVKSPSSATAAPPKSNSGNGGGLFDLDWHDGPAAGASEGAAASSATSPRTSSGAKGGSKTDILSLYATAKPTQPTSPGGGGMSGGMSGLNSSFGGLNMTGNGGVTSPSSTGAAPFASANPWSPNTQQSGATGGDNGLFGATSSNTWATGNAGLTQSNDIWGNATSSSSFNSNEMGNSVGAGKKNDAFDDIWSDFK